MAEDDLELHILNGDFAFNLWEECNFSGQSLIWKETYLEGPLPDTDDLHRFRMARADHLLSFVELSGMDRDRLCRFLKKLDDSVLDLPENAALYLWFDSCIFDQTILMRILYLLHRKNDPSVRVFLYCCDGNCLKINDFKIHNRHLQKGFYRHYSGVAEESQHKEKGKQKGEKRK